MGLTAERKAVVAPLWVAYKISRSARNRNALVVFYLPMTETAARIVDRKIGHSRFEPDELAGYASFGLITAVGRFNQDQTTGTFETFAWPRIIGSIYDELRRVSWQPRSAFMLERQLSKARTDLEAGGFNLTDTNMAKCLHVTVTKLHRMMSMSARSSTPATWDGPLVSSNPASGESLTLASTIASLDPDPSDIAVNRATIETALHAASQLGDREALVVELYDVKGLTLSAIGLRMGVTESRVCQMHTSAVKHLRQLMHVNLDN